MSLKTGKVLYFLLKIWILCCKICTSWEIALGAIVYCSSGLTGTWWYMVHWLVLIKNVVGCALSLQTIDWKKTLVCRLMNDQHRHCTLEDQVRQSGLASLCSTLVSYYMEMLLCAHSPLPVWLWFIACQIGLVSQGFEGSWVCSSLCCSHYTSHVCCHPHWIEGMLESESVHMCWWLKIYIY